MKTLEEAKKLRRPDLLKEIQERRALIGQMVGWLYPSVLNSEIAVLMEALNKRPYDEK